MGQSTPTTTMALDQFERRYAQFCFELPAREKEWYWDLVERARRHSNAINRRPHMDFERPVLLSMLLGCVEREHELQKQIDALRNQLEEACVVLQREGFVQSRPRPSRWQRRLHV